MLWFSLPLVFATLAKASSLVLQTDGKTSQTPVITESEFEAFYHFAEHAAAAYCNTYEHNYGKHIFCTDQENSACPQIADHSTSILGVFDSGFMGLRAYTAVDHTSKEIVLAIRGADEPRVWAGVSNFTLVDWSLVPHAQAHQQFINPWNYMDPEQVALTMSRAKTLYPDYSMTATGHSLGGAIAMLAAAQLRLEHGFQIDVYSYGAPRLGNDHLSRFINEQQEGEEYRITWLNDPISRLPPGNKGYRHAGVEYWTVAMEPSEEHPLEDGMVKVCEGLMNQECNAGTLGGDMDVHYSYYGNIGGCKPPS